MLFYKDLKQMLAAHDARLALRAGLGNGPGMKAKGR
jgi:hypothetical protein